MLWRICNWEMSGRRGGGGRRKGHSKWSDGVEYWRSFSFEKGESGGGNQKLRKNCREERTGVEEGQRTVGQGR